MEIRELITYEINMLSGIINLTFRTTEDSDNMIREDNISIYDIESMGFGNFSAIYDIFDDDDIYDIEEQEINIESEELLDIINEYYTLYPDRLPNSEII